MVLITGLVLLILLLVFSIYSGIMVKHAARFRYLSSRTVYLTLIYVTSATILLVLILATYLAMFFN